MTIYSRIPEFNKILTDLDLADQAIDAEELRFLSQHLTRHAIADVQVDTILSSGLFIQEMQIQPQQKITEEFHTEGKHVRLFFYLNGDSHVQFGAGNMDYKHEVGMIQRNFLNTDGAGGLVHILKNQKLNYIVIKFSYAFYLSLLKHEQWIEGDPFHQYVLSGDAQNRPNETFFIDSRIINILRDIMNASSVQFQKTAFVHMKLKELLFMLYQISLSGRTDQRLKTPIALLEKVRSYILLNLDNPPSMEVLQLKYELNPKVFMLDFKKYFGKTIYAFVIQERMAKAQRLLQEDYNVNELATNLGYQSVSHFIKVFKSFYGYTPKKAILRLRNQEVLENQSLAAYPVG